LVKSKKSPDQHLVISTPYRSITPVNGGYFLVALTARPSAFAARW